MKVRNTYTAIIKKGEQGYYFGWIEEMPEAMSQGATINELLENLKDAPDKAAFPMKTGLQNVGITT